jgi:starvation-inducible DNA-binding protein
MRSKRKSMMSNKQTAHVADREVQSYGSLVLRSIALGNEDRTKSCAVLNEIIADSQILYALYKKCHWLMRGPTFYQLHLLLDKHAGEQNVLIDAMAERVQQLGGVAIGDPPHVAEMTTIPRPPDGAESVSSMLSRLLEAHEIVLQKVRKAIEKTDKGEDAGSNDLLVSQVLRTNETHVWYITEHLVKTPLEGSLN